MSIGWTYFSVYPREMHFCSPGGVPGGVCLCIHLKVGQVSGFDAKSLRTQLLASAEVEFEWIRQFYVQGLHSLWEPCYFVSFFGCHRVDSLSRPRMVAWTHDRTTGPLGEAAGISSSK